MESFYIRVNGLIQGRSKDNEYYEPDAEIAPHKSDLMLFAYWADVDIKSGDNSEYNCLLVQKNNFETGHPFG